MPTYEYGCSACGTQWEEVQRITEPPVEVCPKCGKSSAQRLISAGTGFILKGGGWYSDLYSSAKSGGNKTEANGTTSSDASQQKDAAASKADSSAAKTESTKTEPKTAPTASTSTTTSST